LKGRRRLTLSKENRLLRHRLERQPLLPLGICNARVSFGRGEHHLLRNPRRSDHLLRDSIHARRAVPAPTVLYSLRPGNPVRRPHLPVLRVSILILNRIAPSTSGSFPHAPSVLAGHFVRS